MSRDSEAPTVRCNCIRREGFHARSCPLNDDAIDAGYGIQRGPWRFVRTMGGEYLLVDAANDSRLATFGSQEDLERFGLWLAGEEGELVGLHGLVQRLEAEKRALIEQSVWRGREGWWTGDIGPAALGPFTTADEALATYRASLPPTP